ncbi:major capsid protein [Pseudomonas sp.]|uniref:major capsid protein n=1 Tax=Pseudomonas sp. TaxID=306 RepID=UPI003FD73BBF
MALSYNPNNLNQVVDLSTQINYIPNQWGLYNSLGMFSNEMLATRTALVPRFQQALTITGDRGWDERNSVQGNYTRDALLIQVPHFPLDDSITPNDINGMVDFTNVFAGIQTESVNLVRDRKMQMARQSHAQRLELARAQLINDGTVYAPNGTMKTSYGSTVNYFQEFGVTQTALTLALNDLTQDPLAGVEPIIATIQDRLQNGVFNYEGIMCVCSPDFFSKLIAHPFVRDTYKYFNQQQSAMLLNGRLSAPGSMGLDDRFRSFSYGGITFVEYRGSIGGQLLVPAGEARAFPLQRDGSMYKTYYSPAPRFSTVNRPASEVYYFEHRNDKDDIIEIMTESNFANAVLRPQAIIKLTIV